ncbi:hypothetical protein [Streptomyces sp. ISL-100]|uniref:hypothetical protein n=1 Tax=Streptomyces sp. ISL-100 TaxID=2819173 RepID=UPI001BEBE0E3|nr:hypothetical protein [Streptomyces sp. ISL-100]MBT2401286.1 hypothetical protein [Streptomyces sp. ISL-100]
MTAVAVEITARPQTLSAVPAPVRPASPEPEGVIIVSDVEALASGSTPGCGNDNPYQ